MRGMEKSVKDRMKKIAIITARGGSKRIPRKNIKDFCGKPILAYSIEAAVSSGLFVSRKAAASAVPVGNILDQPRRNIVDKPGAIVELNLVIQHTTRSVRQKQPFPRASKKA